MCHGTHGAGEVRTGLVQLRAVHETTLGIGLDFLESISCGERVFSCFCFCFFVLARLRDRQLNKANQGQTI